LVFLFLRGKIAGLGLPKNNNFLFNGWGKYIKGQVKRKTVKIHLNFAVSPQNFPPKKKGPKH